MNLNSFKDALEERLQEIDKYASNPPDIKPLSHNDLLDYDKIMQEYSRVVTLSQELNRIIFASEYLQSKTEEAISMLSSNLEIELKQKTVLKRGLDLLKCRTYPLYGEQKNYTNMIVFYQGRRKDVR